MINCDALEEFQKNCDNNLGSMYQFIYNDSENLTVTLDDATNKVTAVVNATQCLSMSFRKGQANFTEPSAIDLVAGSSITTGTIAMNPTRRDAQRSRALKVMAQGQRYIDGFAKDGNGLWWYFPVLQLITLGGGSGASVAEGSKYEIVLANEVGIEKMAYVIDEALVLPLLDPVP